MNELNLLLSESVVEKSIVLTALEIASVNTPSPDLTKKISRLTTVLFCMRHGHAWEN